MQDDLTIPKSLDLRIPENLARHEEARRNWKPGARLSRAERAPRIERDRKGRPLPAGLDDAGRAILREQERVESQVEREREKDRKDERSRPATKK